MLREVKIGDLKHTLFARAGLNELDTDHVAYLEALVKGGAQLAPITITPDNEIIDGRHRLRVYQDLSYDTIHCEVIAGKTRMEYQAFALKANSGGAKPPNRADLTFVLTQLQKAGGTDAAIFALLSPPYPKKVIKEQLDWNRSNERLLKFRAALKLRNEEDLTFKQVAERTGLPETELKEFIKTGGKRRGKQENQMAALQRRWKEPNHSYGTKLTNLFAATFEAFDAGQLTEEQVITLLKIPSDYGRKVGHRSDEAIERFAAHLAASRKVAG